MHARPSPGLLDDQGPRLRAASARPGCPRPVPPGRHPDADDAAAARLRAAGRRQQAGRPDRDADLAGHRARRRWSARRRRCSGTSWPSGWSPTPACSAVLRLALMALAVGWAALFMDAWRIGHPLSLQQSHRLAVVGLNGVLCFAVAGALLFGAHLVGRAARLHASRCSATASVTGAHDGRYNVLLLGGDSGAGRWGLRPDSHDRRQHRRRHRQDGADRAAAQHGETSRSPRAR